MIKPRAFNTIEIHGNVLTKTSVDKQTLADESKWYFDIPGDVRRFVPTVYPSHNGELNMEYVHGATLHESFVSGEYGICRWSEILFKIKEFTDAMASYRVCDAKAIGDSLRRMYLDKTRERLMSLREDVYFSRFFAHRPIINGIECPNIEELCARMESDVSRLYDRGSFTIIHGDLHFGNIILGDDDGIKAIDPRGRFGRFTVYGDQRYDLAKLYHSIEGGYDYIIEDMYHLEYDGLDIDYTIEPSEYGFDMLALMREIFEIEQQEDIRLIEALLFLSMVPLHSESREHQIVMFARGMELYKRATE